MKAIIGRYWRAIHTVPVPLWRALRAMDNRDWHVYGGLALAGVGGWSLTPAWTCITIGGALVLFGLFGDLLDRWTARLTEDHG